MFILLKIFFLTFIQRHPMQVAWLYNIRGKDVAYCPVVHAFAIVTSNNAFIYVDKRKVSNEVS
jgi:Xaa-Pro aminopeptidase